MNDYFIYWDIDPYKAVDLMWSWYPNPRLNSSYEHNRKKLKDLFKGKSLEKQKEIFNFLTNNKWENTSTKLIELVKTH